MTPGILVQSAAICVGEAYAKTEHRGGGKK